MIRLTGEAPQPRWYDVDPTNGVRLQLAPVSLAALQRARRLGGAAYRAAGSDADVGGVAVSVALIAHACLAWEGVGDAKGKPVEPSPERVEQLLEMRPDIYQTLDRDYVGTHFALAAEKNGSSASPRGASAKAGKPIAQPAPVPARNARSGSTPRKPRTAKQSGT